MPEYTIVTDISHWKFPVSFQSMKQGGIDFCIAKATEGTAWTDPYYTEYVKIMGDYGIVDGSYHYYLGKLDPIAQAGHYFRTAEKAAMPWAYDVERRNNVGSDNKPLLAPAEFTAKLLSSLLEFTTRSTTASPGWSGSGWASACTCSSRTAARFRYPGPRRVAARAGRGRRGRAAVGPGVAMSCSGRWSASPQPWPWSR